MSVLLDERSRIVVQGLTGKEGTFHARACKAYHGTQVVAGVTPGKGGQSVDDMPVYDTVAEAVAKLVPNVDVTINKNAQPDKRSYRVNFDKFAKLAQGFLPAVDLQSAVIDLRDGLRAMKFQDPDFRAGEFMRLVTLKRLRESRHLTSSLEWSDRPALER